MTKIFLNDKRIIGCVKSHEGDVWFNCPANETIPSGMRGTLHWEDMGNHPPAEVYENDTVEVKLNVTYERNGVPVDYIR